MRCSRRFPRRLSLSVTTTLFIALIISGCKTLPPTNDPGTVTLSRELEETRRTLEELTHRLSVVQFMVDSHERAISDLERQGVAAAAPKMMEPTPEPKKAAKVQEAKILEESLAAGKPKSKVVKKARKKSATSNLANASYTKAFEALKQKKYSRSLMLFREVAEKWPDSDLADNAIYWSGEIHYTKGDYSAAVQSFRTLLSKYPKGSKVPDALLKTGFAYLALKDKDSARKYLKRVVVEHPFSTSGAKAERMLNDMDENPQS